MQPAITLPDHLNRAAAEYPHLGIVFVGEDGASGFLSYPELLQESLLVAVVKAYATGHLSDAVDGLSAPLPDLPLETVLTRFGERMLLVLTNDGTALAVYRMVIAEAGRSDIGMLFHDAGPGEAIESLAAFLALAMQKGQLGNADADLRARQFLALVTAQTNMRLYQSDPAPLDVIEIKQLVKNAVEMFLYGAVR